MFCFTGIYKKFEYRKKGNSSWSYSSDTGSFFFISTDVRDTGYYFCLGKNNAKDSLESDNRLLTIKAPPKVLESSKLVRRQGSNFRLYFKYTGISLVTSVVWKFDDSDIDNDRYQIRSNNVTGQYEYGQTKAQRTELNWMVNCPYDGSYNGLYEGLLQMSDSTLKQVIRIKWAAPDDLCPPPATPSSAFTTSTSDVQVGEKRIDTQNSNTTVIVTSVCVVFFVALAGFFVIVFSWKKWQLKSEYFPFQSFLHTLK